MEYKMPMTFVKALLRIEKHFSYTKPLKTNKQVLEESLNSEFISEHEMDDILSSIQAGSKRQSGSTVEKENVESATVGKEKGNVKPTGYRKGSVKSTANDSIRFLRRFLKGNRTMI